jgi:hypothetical protein
MMRSTVSNYTVSLPVTVNVEILDPDLTIGELRERVYQTFSHAPLGFDSFRVVDIEVHETSINNKNESRSIEGSTVFDRSNMSLDFKSSSFHDIVGIHANSEVQTEAFRINKRLVPGTVKAIPVYLYFSAGGNIVVDWVAKFEVEQ